MVNKKFIIILSIIVLVLVILGALFIYGLPFDRYAVRSGADEIRIQDLAIQNKDISICDKMHFTGFLGGGDGYDDQLVSSCYRKYAPAFPDENVCSRRLNDLSCLEAEVRVSKDTSHCSNFAYCFAVVAEIKKDITVCNLMKDSKLQQACKEQYRKFLGY
ncbi:MAG: hypothetical protein AABW80_01880 [Nanoarchaeota archaeon]